MEKSESYIGFLMWYSMTCNHPHSNHITGTCLILHVRHSIHACKMLEMATYSSWPLQMKNSNLHAWTADRMRDAMPTAVMKLQEDCGPHSSMMKRCFDTVMFSFCHIPRVKSKHLPRKSSVFSERGTTAMKPNTKAKK